MKAKLPKSAKIVSHIHHEMALHVEYCKGFGVSQEDMEACEESQGELEFFIHKFRMLNGSSLYCVYEVRLFQGGLGSR